MSEIIGENRYTVCETADGYRVCRCLLSDGKNVTVTGNIPGELGLRVKYIGEWEKHKKYGLQFKASDFELVPPDNEKSVIAYLISLKCGIGKTWAKRIYDAFKNDTWQVLSTNPDRLLEIKQFGKKRKERLVEKMNETKTVREIMKTLSDITEITNKKAELIAKVFGKKSIDIIQKSPYDLCDIKGIGFKTAEVIAKRFNINPSDEKRIEAGILYFLRNVEVLGHVCVPKSMLIQKAYEILNYGYFKKVVSKDNCEKILSHMTLKNKIKIEEVTVKSQDTIDMIYSLRSWEEETNIMQNIKRLLSFSCNTMSGGIEKIEKSLEMFSNENKFTLAKAQKEGAIKSLTSKISIITGGPGTGKTSTIKSILYAHSKMHPDSNPLLLAPTGRAARRMSEATGYPAQTIHSAIGYHSNDEDEYGECSVYKLESNLIIVDESSMIDQHIMSSFISTVKDDCQLIFVGDPNQLPSVGYGNILHDMIISGIIPKTKLETIFRQGENSLVITNAEKILKGDTNIEFSKKEFIMLECDNELEILQKGCMIYKKCISKFDIDDVMLLSPYRKQTAISVQSFNKQIQHIINPEFKTKGELTINSGNVQFRKNDKIMQMKNKDCAKNGDIGYVKNICYAYDKDGDNNFSTVTHIEFNNDGQDVTYSPEDMKNIDLAYASTIHKSQGSEYKTIIIIMSELHINALKRNLIYTAITRASENVIIVGQKSALDYAIKNDQSDIRYSNLACRLKKGFKENKNRVNGGTNSGTQKTTQLSII